MAESTGPKLSVRADARRSVAPDSAVLIGIVSARMESKAAALAAAAVGVNALIEELGALGGVVASVTDERRALTWSVASTTSHPEFDKQSGSGLTGWVIASASLQLTVRDFELLDALGSALARHEAFSVHSVQWRVDADNPAWSIVRAAAIGEAIQKGRDYAAALGAELDHLDHIADTGLLDGGSDRSSTRPVATRAAGFATPPADTPALDPVPQELIATIEARFTMTAVSLAAAPNP